ncbi:hypothetical protein SLEP1_g25335 [Rubroshorea leprosula]|uniref:Uncharacterized protein n=1 Tax=Rubroshorea leprosula TaxID=152421 RepID=A0AAV5JID2_9ROSI|nr:hypothetical protein SLEP1_g25335 [Rubroshorea leprosula]
MLLLLHLRPPPKNSPYICNMSVRKLLVGFKLSVVLPFLICIRPF